jgi:glycine/D-amino acid oxidase-like deaminating enzyme
MPVMHPLEARYRARSLWLDGIPTPLLPRPSLTADTDCDVVIVGAGFTGLWTAYYLHAADPQLRIVVIDREIAGFGASGRNGGWVSAGVAADLRVYSDRYGADAIRRAERATFDTVSEVGRVVAAEQINCGFTHAGAITVATSNAQLARLRGAVERRRAFGVSEQDLRFLGLDELNRRVRVAGALDATFTPHCARIDPARLVRGLADVVAARGVTILERTAAREIEPGRVVCAAGTIRAASVLVATESYTIQQAGNARRFLPLYSLMIATEPLPDSVWDELGWAGCETVGDYRHLFFYAQRTADGRIAIGGRGAPYRLGSPIDERYERNDAVRDRLVATIRANFPAAAPFAITHHWGGSLGVPRDWTSTVTYDAGSGLGFAGGYSGHGVCAANLYGRTLADLVVHRDSDLVSMPWVGHRSRSWEPEPLRFAASRAIVGILGSADQVEPALGTTARRVRLVAPFVAGRP